MGVRGLKSYVERNAKDGGVREHRLADCHLVIDAANFVHFFYNFTYDYGGEYDLYVDRLQRLLDKFERCRIKPLFVFDGAKDWDGGKIRQQLRRMAERAAGCKELLQTGQPSQRARLLPILTYDVFSQVVVERGFPVATVLTGDADEQTATIAGHLGCPLLTGDSDFFLYPLPGGVIPSDSLDLSDEGLASKESFMQCRLYQQSECRLTRLDNLALRPDLAPLWASLAGNDYVSENEASEARQRVGCRAFGRGDAVITESIRWTHRFESAKDCLAELRRRLRPDLMSRFEASLRHYQLKPDSEAVRLIDGRIEFPKPAPAPLTDAHRRRRKLVFFIDALLYRKVILPIGLEHPGQPGAFESTRQLRAVAYSLENYRQVKSAESASAAAVVEVVEYVREGTEVRQKSVRLTPEHRCPGAGGSGDVDVGDRDAEDSATWRCVMNVLDATDAELISLLPGRISSNRRLRLALHALRRSRTGGEANRKEDVRLKLTGRCVVRALLALCLLRFDETDGGDGDDSSKTDGGNNDDGDDEDEEPPRKRAGSTVNFESYFAPDVAVPQTAPVQGDRHYLAVLHQFNEFQAHLVSLMLFLQAHTVQGEFDRLIDWLPKLLAGRFVYRVAAELASRQLDWDRCLAALADWLRPRGVGYTGLQRLDDWLLKEDN